MNILRLPEFKIQQSRSAVFIEHKGKMICSYDIDLLIAQDGKDFELLDGTIMSKDDVELMVLYLINMRRLPKSKGGLI